MDANGTRLHLLLGYDDWGVCSESPGLTLREAWEASPPGSAQTDLAWDADRNELTLRLRLFQFPAAPRDKPPNLEDRRGAGRDRYGNWYWIDEDGQEILVKSAGTGQTTHFWSAGDGLECSPDEGFGDFHSATPRQMTEALSLGGLAVTDDHYLVGGVLDPAGLLVFDLHAGGPPQQVCWPTGVEFAPFDMAPAPGGGVRILDRVNRRYWALDRHLQVIRMDQTETVLQPEQVPTFQPVGGSTPRRRWARTFPEGITLAASSPVTAHDAIAIEALPDGTVLILDRPPDDGNSPPDGPFSRVYRYRFGRQVGKEVSTEVMKQLIEQDSQAGFRLLGHDFAFVPDHSTEEGALHDRLYVADSGGNQAYAFVLAQQDDGQLTLRPLPDYLPMRLFGGKALVAAGERAYYDFGDGWVPLVAQRRPRYSEEAAFETPLDPAPPAGPGRRDPTRRQAFDGHEPGCVWHRLLLDACIPPETSVTVWSRAADDPRDLAVASWQEEPRPYLRGDGSELPFVRKPPPAPGRGTWELLFQRARGRYLQLKLRLTGNGRTTPRLRALRVYYPRFSYLDHYLPAVYREDEASASFLDRFLANIEGFPTALEDKIAAVQLLFDVRSAPPDVLGWLAGWSGVALDPAWGEAQQRLFIRHAMDFFQYRGTPRGVQMALRLVHDACPDESIFTDPFGTRGRRHPIRIVEKYRTRRTPQVVLGDPTEPAGPRPASPAQRWLPAEGGVALHRRFTDYLFPPRNGRSHALVEFPLAAPDYRPGDWQRFAERTLGFVPSASDADLPRWQEFLARLYHRVRALNEAYGGAWAAFEEVPLPDGLPADGAPLQDWYQFQAVVLAMRRAAHRFTVLLPAPRDDTPDRAEHRRRVELTKRVVELEKPAHTRFDVKFYWAYFRVGEVRLGEDTVLDLGSRDPRLLPPLVLGRGYLAEGLLAPGHPQNVTDRHVVSRDAPAVGRATQRIP